MFFALRMLSGDQSSAFCANSERISEAGITFHTLDEAALTRHWQTTASSTSNATGAPNARYESTMFVGWRSSASSTLIQAVSKDGGVRPNAATGTTQTIPVRKVDVRQDAGTLMPPGLTASLSRAELRDLIRFLSDQKGQDVHP